MSAKLKTSHRTNSAPMAPAVYLTFLTSGQASFAGGFEVAVAIACLPGAFICAMPRYKMPLGATAISFLLASCGAADKPKAADTAPAIENIFDDPAPGKALLASTIAPFFEEKGKGEE